MYKYTYAENLCKTLYIEIKKQMLKEFPSDKINVTKNALFFASSSSSQFYFQLIILK